MRTSKVYSITMPPEMGRRAERLARKENRTMSELMREAFRRYQQSEDTRAIRRRQLQALDAAAGSWKDQDHPELKRGAAPLVRKLRRDFERRFARTASR